MIYTRHLPGILIQNDSALTLALKIHPEDQESDIYAMYEEIDLTLSHALEGDAGTVRYPKESEEAG